MPCNKGFGLIEILIVSTLMATGLLLFSRVLALQIRGQKHVELRGDLESIRRTVLTSVTCPAPSHCAEDGLISLLDSHGNTFIDKETGRRLGAWTLRARCENSTLHIQAALLNPGRSLASTDPLDYGKDPLYGEQTAVWKDLFPAGTNVCHLANPNEGAPPLSASSTEWSLRNVAIKNDFLEPGFPMDLVNDWTTIWRKKADGTRNDLCVDRNNNNVLDPKDEFNTGKKSRHGDDRIICADTANLLLKETSPQDTCAKAQTCPQSLEYLGRQLCACPSDITSSFFYTAKGNLFILSMKGNLSSLGTSHTTDLVLEGRSTQTGSWQLLALGRHNGPEDGAASVTVSIDSKMVVVPGNAYEFRLRLISTDHGGSDETAARGTGFQLMIHDYWAPDSDL